MKTTLLDVPPAPVSKPWKNRVLHFPSLGKLALALLLGAGGAFAANTDGTVSFTVTTTNYTASYNPRNVAAVWVVDSSGAFVKTLCRHGVSRVGYLYKWIADRGTYTNVDGVTSATLSTQPQTHAVTWNCRGTNNSVVADGTYYVRVEYTSANAQGPYTANYCSFTKGTAAATNTFANYSNGGGQFLNMTLIYTPSTEIGVTALAPSAGLINSNIPVVVTVTNQSAGTLDYTVSLTNLTSSGLIGSQAITGMPGNSSTNVTINWNTTGLSVGSYQLRALAGPLATETNTTDNARTNTVTLSSPLINDLAILQLTPATGFINSNLAVVVAVTNLTTNAVNAVNLSLSNITAAATFIATQQLATLAARAGTNVTLNWNTSALTAGVYKLQARVAPVTGEIITNNNLMTNAVTLRAAFHDLAVGPFTLAPIVPPSRLTNVLVAVTNTGDYAETFNFTLTDLTAAQTIGTRGITNLASTAMTNVTFAWNTTNAALAAHTLQAVAGPLVSELTLLNNTNTTSVLITAGMETNTLLARGSSWKYLDTGRDLSGAPWMKADFFDGFWSNGVAPLGYGLPNIATTVGYGGNPGNRNITTYFRREFFADGIILTVTGRVLRTDGVVLYLNGAELARQNMAAGAVSAATLATTNNAGTGATNYFGFAVPTNLLVTGRNLLAAEVHLASATNAALGFDLELTTQNPIVTHVTNIAVSALEPAGPVQLGDRAGFTVTLTNKGDVTTAYTVLLKDLTTGAILASRTMSGLAAGEYTTVNLAWSTFGGLATNHTLQAQTVVNGSTNVTDVAAATQGVSAVNFTVQPVNATASIGGRCNAVAVSGSTVYLGCGATLEIWDATTPATPVRLGQVRLPGNIEHLLINGPLVLAAAGASGVHAVDVSTPASPLYKGTYDSSGFAGSMAAVGSTVYLADGAAGVRMLDLSNPDLPALAGAYQTTGPAQALALNGQNLLVMDGADGLQLLTTNVPAPALTGAYHGVTATLGIVAGSGFALASDANGGLYRINTSVVAAPALAASAQLPGAGRALALVGSTAYVAAGAVGLLTVDATTLAVQATNSIAGGEAADVAASGGALYVAAGFAGCQIFSPGVASPTLLGTIQTSARPVDAAALGASLFVAADEGGLQVHSMTNFAKPVRLAAVTAAGNARCVAVAAPLVFVGDGYNGMKVFNVTNAAAPVLVGSYTNAGLGLIRRLAVAGNRAALTDGSQIQLLNIASPAAPTLVATNVPGNFVFDLAAGSNTIFAACGSAGLRMFSASGLTAQGNYATPGPALGISVNGNTAQVAMGSNGWQTLNIATPGAPTLVQSRPGQVFDVTMPGVLTFVVDGARTGQVFNVTTPATPVSTQTFTALARALRVRAMGGLMLTAEDEAGLGIFNVSTNDVNLNGIPDTWDQQVVDANTTDNLRSLWDITADGLGANGFTFYQSYVAGLTPTDAHSVFVITALNPAPGTGGAQFIVTWTSVPGKSYTLNKATDLLAGFSVLQSNIVAAATLTSYTDTVGTAQAYYMVEVK